MATATKSTKAATTAPTAAAPATKPTPAPTAAASPIDISKLTPDQLAALQKQLKKTTKTAQGDSAKRFELIDGMLKEKDEAGGFIHTTRDIMNALVKGGFVNTTVNGFEQNEIKKVQARKQFLEKRREKDGTLTYPSGTFGYKPSDATPFSLTAGRIASWFENADNVESLSDEQKEAITEALS